MNAHYHQKCRNHEGCQSEATLDEKPGGIGSHTATAVAELLVLIEELPLARSFDHALVGCTCTEIGDECEHQITGENE